MDNITVTVPSSYSFVSSLSGDDEERKDVEANYNVTIVATPSGDFEVTGLPDDVESYVDDICIGDRHAVSDIMRTER